MVKVRCTHRTYGLGPSSILGTTGQDRTGQINGGGMSYTEQGAHQKKNWIHLFISLKIHMRSNMESPMNIPEILDLLAPIALEIITPRAHTDRGERRETSWYEMRHTDRGERRETSWYEMRHTGRGERRETWWYEMRHRVQYTLRYV
jgi:hypothetical protein